MSLIAVRPAFELEKRPCDRVSARNDLGGGALKNNLPSPVAAFRSQVDNPVSLPDKLSVMLHNNDGAVIVHHTV